jgi:hypothetical protein
MPILNRKELSEYQRFDLNDELLRLNLAFNQKEVISALLKIKKART